MAKRKYNWEKIDVLYAVGDMSLRELADSEGIPFHTLAAHARRSKYSEKRTEYKRLVLEKAKDSMAERDAGVIETLMTAAEKLAILLEQYVLDDATLHNYIIGGAEVRLEKLDTKALCNLSGVLRDVAATLKILQPDQTVTNDCQGVIILSERMEEQ